MSQYSKTTKQQLDAYNRTFSTTLNSGYKNAFIQCRQSNVNCDTMKSQLVKVRDTLSDVKNLAASVKSVVDKKKTTVSTYENSLISQKKEFQDKRNQWKRVVGERLGIIIIVNGWNSRVCLLGVCHTRSILLIVGLCITCS